MSVLRRLGKDSAGSPETGTGAEVQLRVVFQKRDGGDKHERQLDNAADLIAACNAWRYTAPSGARVRAQCTEVGRGWGARRGAAGVLSCRVA